MALAQRERVAAPPAVRPTPVSERATTLNRQDALYPFPGHHLPHRDAQGGAARSPSRDLEYLCCLRHVSLLIEELDAASLLDVSAGHTRPITIPPNVSRTDAARDRFDVVTAIDVLQHIPDSGVSAFLRSIDARVAPGGHAVIAVPSVATPLAAGHFRHYDERLLRTQVKEAGARLHIVSVEHVFRHRGLAHRWLDLLDNRFWTIDPKPLRRFTWRLVWNHLRLGTARNARHMVAVLRKI